MSLRPFPDASRMRWRRLDVPGHEEADMLATPSGWRLRGHVVVAERGVDANLDYTIDCDAAWRTRVALVDGDVDHRRFRLAVTADGAGHWVREGERVAALDGALDIDLSFTPATNTLPIRRLGLAVGAAAPVRSAWLRLPELRFEPLEQTYTREAEFRFHYHADIDGEPFDAGLEIDAFGRVVRYEGLWVADL